MWWLQETLGRVTVQSSLFHIHPPCLILLPRLLLLPIRITSTTTTTSEVYFGVGLCTELQYVRTYSDKLWVIWWINTLNECSWILSMSAAEYYQWVKLNTINEWSWILSMSEAEYYQWVKLNHQSMQLNHPYCCLLHRYRYTVRIIQCCCVTC